MREGRLALRVASAQSSTGETLRKALAGLEQTLPVFQVRTLAQAIRWPAAGSTSHYSPFSPVRRSYCRSYGIYGVVAYLIGQRTIEKGDPYRSGRNPPLLQMILHRGMRMVVVGHRHRLGHRRRSHDPGDPATFFEFASLVALTALLACIGPALGAAMADPMRSLRSE